MVQLHALGNMVCHEHAVLCMTEWLRSSLLCCGRVNETWVVMCVLCLLQVFTNIGCMELFYTQVGIGLPAVLFCYLERE
jgi:hypothetical protein